MSGTGMWRHSPTPPPHLGGALTQEQWVAWGLCGWPKTKNRVSLPYLSVPTEHEHGVFWRDMRVLCEIPQSSSVLSEPPSYLRPDSDWKVISDTSFLKTKRVIDSMS